MKNPCIDHWNAIICILRYLEKALDKVYFYSNKGNTQIFGYCDADWASFPMDKHSTRHRVFVGGNIIFWKGKKQNVVV